MEHSSFSSSSEKAADPGGALEHELALGDGETEFRDKACLQGHRVAERHENRFTEPGLQCSGKCWARL